MTTLIAQELESEALHRFHADFRRALLMHRKESLNLFSACNFPWRRVSYSIGAAEVTGNEPIPAVIKRADAALYRAKQSGRNRLEMDDPRMT